MHLDNQPVSPDRARELCGRIGATRIAVIGDIMLDRYLMGDADRISPEAPVPVVMVDDERVVPGGAANVAANVRAAGGTALLVGATGDDVDAAYLREALHAIAIATDGIIAVGGRPTTTKTRLMARGQQVVRIDREVTNPLGGRFRQLFLAAALAAIDTADVLLLEDYDKGTIDAASAGELVAAARARRIPIVVDPKIRNFFAYSGATVFKPNRRELDAAFATHYSGDDADLEGARQRLGAEHLLLTLGADGVALVSENEPVRRAGSLAHDVFDVSGAGDTVAAWVATILAAGGTVAEACWLSNVAAGVEVGKRGTATVAPHELLEALPLAS